MQNKAARVEDYINQLPGERKEPMRHLRQCITDNLPSGFEEIIQYGMISYVVPHSVYPNGYHCNPKDPLPFLGIASQKNFIALHHMGIYADKDLHDWFVKEYPKYVKTKLDMGKSCIRFKKMENIPYPLISELAQKMTADEWVALYEKNVKKN